MIRDEFEMTGTKYGCVISMCGACAVHLNGEPIRSCMTPLSAIGDGEIDSAMSGNICRCGTYNEIRAAIKHVAEASIENGMAKVHHVWSAVHCGRVVNPEGARRQIEARQEPNSGPDAKLGRDSVECDVHEFQIAEFMTGMRKRVVGPLARNPHDLPCAASAGERVIDHFKKVLKRYMA